MKGLRIFTLLVAFAITFMQTAPAAPPPGDSVTGSGVAITGEAFSVEATSNAEGKGAKGTLSFSVTDPSALGDVTVRVSCLMVNGNEAVIGGRVTSSTSSAFEKNDGVRWYVHEDVPDDLRIEPASTPVDCSTSATNSPIQSGDLTIVDN